MNNKIVIWTSPTSRFQKIYVFKDDIIIDQLGVTVEDLTETLTALMDKYNIHRLDFSGVKSYSEGLVKDLQENTMLKFGANDIRINYI